MVDLLTVGGIGAVLYFLLTGKEKPADQKLDEALTPVSQKVAEQMMPATVPVETAAAAQAYYAPAATTAPVAAAAPAKAPECVLLKTPPLEVREPTAEEYKLAEMDRNAVRREEYARYAEIHKKYTDLLKGVHPMSAYQLALLARGATIPETTLAQVRQQLAAAGVSETDAARIGGDWDTELRAAQKHYADLLDRQSRAATAVRIWREAQATGINPEIAKYNAQGYTVHKVTAGGKVLYYACPPGALPPAA